MAEWSSAGSTDLKQRHFITALAAVGVVVLIGTVWTAGNRVSGGRLSAVEQGTADVVFTVGEREYIAQRRDQPGGTFVIEIVEVATGQIRITSTPANPAMRCFFFEDGGIIWFYSGDIGTFAFEQQAGVWSESANPQHRISEEAYGRLTSLQQDRMRRWRPRMD